MNEEKSLGLLVCKKKDQNSSPFSHSTLSHNSLSLSLSDDEMNDAEETARNKRGGAVVALPVCVWFEEHE